LAFESPGEDGDNQEYFNARELMMEAARQGGWRREINDNIPGLDKDNNPADHIVSKWDLEPDNYFEARDGEDLEDALRRAILGMLNRASSGTSAAVVRPEGRSQGESTLLQAHFRPLVPTDQGDIEWTGYLNALWIDPWGNIREESDDGGLDFASNNIVKYEFFEGQGTLARRYKPDYDEEDGEYVAGDPVGDYVELEELQYIFDAGKELWNRAPNKRRIYTYDENMPDGTDKKIAFDNTNLSDIKPFLGVNNASVSTAYSLEHLGPEGGRAETLIRYIRGEDFEGLRPRTIEIDGEDNTWKLGDIVRSTPTIVAGARENYHLIYNDTTYRDWQRKKVEDGGVRDRETMVYAGANDGMLHAFTHGKYDRENMKFEEVKGDPYDEESDALGTEVWSYIPQALLPHLKWLADPNYTHVYYVDLQPRVFDAKFNGEWGTYLLLGLNLGGKRIYVNMEGEERIFYPSYTLIDITEPREPVVMWERSYEGSGLTTSYPGVFKVGDKWFGFFGSGFNDDSGKTDYQGRSDQQARIYIINLKTGEPYSKVEEDWFVKLSNDNAFLNSPSAFDKNVNYHMDAIYFGETYLDNPGPNESWKGNVHKISVDVGEDFDYTERESANDWSHSLIFESPGPVTAPLSLRTAPDDNVMVFFGTGRYMEQLDITDDQQQYLFGIKDPDYDPENSGQVDFNDTDLFNATSTEVTEVGNVYDHEVTAIDDPIIWDAFEYYVRDNFRGWYRELEKPNPTPSERIISKPGIIGRTLMVPTYTPSDDVCLPGGESNVLALYSYTGTGFRRHILPEEYSTGKRDDAKITAIRLEDDMVGAPAGSIAFHPGSGTTWRAFITTSVGGIGSGEGIKFEPVIKRSRISGWRDR